LRDTGPLLRSLPMRQSTRQLEAGSQSAPLPVRHLTDSSSLQSSGQSLEHHLQTKQYDDAAETLPQKFGLGSYKHACSQEGTDEHANHHWHRKRRIDVAPAQID